MRKKNTGLNAGGLAHPEILPGDIFRDSRGELITIKSVTPVRISYQRKGYPDECACTPERLFREFTPVKRQTLSEWCKATDVSGKIQNLRAIIAAKRAGK